jgi:hypothetical protein
VVELLAHLDHNGRVLAWPVAVVAESPDDVSVVFRTYCSQWPVDERRHLRPPILQPGQAHPGDVVARYQDGLAAGDTEAVVSSFAPDGYFRGPFGPHYAHRGTDELRSFFTRCFSAGGGIGLQHCAVTDDGVRCALEYNCVRWGSHALPPQAGLGSTSAAQTGCWPRPASTTTSNHLSGTPEAAGSDHDCHAASRVPSLQPLESCPAAATLLRSLPQPAPGNRIEVSPPDTRLSRATDEVCGLQQYAA